MTLVKGHLAAGNRIAAISIGGLAEGLLVVEALGTEFLILEPQLDVLIPLMLSLYVIRRDIE